MTNVTFKTPWQRGSDGAMENWGLLGVAGVQLLPPKAEGRDRRKGQINSSSLKKDFFLVGYLASGCPWEAQGPLRASRVLAGWEMRYRLLPVLFLCFLKPTYKGFWNIKNPLNPSNWICESEINQYRMEYHNASCNIPTMPAKLYLIHHLFTHTLSQTHTHKLCNTVCVKMFQYPNTVVG